MLLGRAYTYVEGDISKEAIMVAKRMFMAERMVFTHSVEDQLPIQLPQLKYFC